MTARSAGNPTAGVPVESVFTPEPEDSRIIEPALPTPADPLSFGTPEGQSYRSIEVFLAAIRERESGGQYNALNEDSGASGAYQFLPSNWESWSRQVFGEVVPWRNNPRAQDRVARWKMTQYWNKYQDWQLVALAWRAGPAHADRIKRGDASLAQVIRTLVDPRTGASLSELVSSYIGFVTRQISGTVPPPPAFEADLSTGQPVDGAAGLLSGDPFQFVDPTQILQRTGFASQPPRQPIEILGAAIAGWSDAVASALSSVASAETEAEAGVQKLSGTEPEFDEFQSQVDV